MDCSPSVASLHPQRRRNKHRRSNRLRTMACSPSAAFHPQPRRSEGPRTEAWRATGRTGAVRREAGRMAAARRMAEVAVALRRSRGREGCGGSRILTLRGERKLRKRVEM
uniref:Uncharacterized protein n=1 Tax=Opuntia streptacantha TaxID=393608 RepID=A0A7C8YGN1_OPUST